MRREKRFGGGLGEKWGVWQEYTVYVYKNVREQNLLLKSITQNKTKQKQNNRTTQGFQCNVTQQLGDFLSTPMKGLLTWSAVNTVLTWIAKYSTPITTHTTRSDCRRSLCGAEGSHETITHFFVFKIGSHAIQAGSKSLAAEHAPECPSLLTPPPQCQTFLYIQLKKKKKTQTPFPHNW